MMVPAIWTTFHSDVKGQLTCPEIELYDPREWTLRNDIDSYQKKIQRCKEKSTLLEASGFNFNNQTNECSIRKCSGSRTYGSSSTLVGVFEFEEYTFSVPILLLELQRSMK
eukprot:Awhi_evm2s5839